MDISLIIFPLLCPCFILSLYFTLTTTWPLFLVKHSASVIKFAATRKTHLLRFVTNILPAKTSWPYAYMMSIPQVIMVSLDDYTATNGSTVVIPGCHTWDETPSISPLRHGPSHHEFRKPGFYFISTLGKMMALTLPLLDDGHWRCNICNLGVGKWRIRSGLSSLTIDFPILVSTTSFPLCLTQIRIFITSIEPS